jgi:hypothetical protein
VNVSGDVDGETVVLRSGYYVQDTREVFDNGDQLLQMVFSSTSNACSFDSDFLRAIDTAEEPIDFAAASAAYLAPERFVLTATLRLQQVAALGEGSRVEIVEAEALTTDVATVGYQQFLQQLDEDYWERPSERPLYITEHGSSAGSILIDQVGPGAKLGGELTVDLEDRGDVVGTLDVDFRIERCLVAETYLYDLPRLADAAPD